MSDIMGLFEIIYAETIEADDFFDAVDKAKVNGIEILSVSQVVPEEEENVFD